MWSTAIRAIAPWRRKRIAARRVAPCVVPTTTRTGAAEAAAGTMDWRISCRDSRFLPKSWPGVIHEFLRCIERALHVGSGGAEFCKLDQVAFLQERAEQILVFLRERIVARD